MKRSQHLSRARRENSLDACHATISARGAIFDLDGTLINSLADIAAAVNAALRRHHERAVDVDLVRRSIGDGMRMLCRRVAPRAGERKISSICASVADEYRSHCLESTRLYRGIAALLDRLSRAQFRMAVLSNKPDEFTRMIVDGLCRGRWFEIVRGVRQESDRKPRPRLALLIARELKLNPRDIVMIGDSPADIETAKAARMHSIAVTWGFRGADDLRGLRPDGMADVPRDISQLLGAAR